MVYFLIPAFSFFFSLHFVKKFQILLWIQFPVLKHSRPILPNKVRSYISITTVKSPLENPAFVTGAEGFMIRKLRSITTVKSPLENPAFVIGAEGFLIRKHKSY